MNTETSPDFTSNGTHSIETLPPTEPKSQADKRINFLLKRHFENDPDFRPVILELAEYDPTPKKKYLAWLVKHWTGPWNPNKAELERVAACLDIHHRGARYFSPLSWTGLRLEDEGYLADIFRYTPKTLSCIQGKVAEIIQTDEEDKQIRKGNLVVTAGAEVAYQDEKWTLVRIRSDDALKRLGQGTSWCVRHGICPGYRFPFDFMLSRDGERYLANGRAVRDRWNKMPPVEIVAEINSIRNRGADSCERFSAKVRDAIETKQQLSQEEERQLLEQPSLVVDYAVGIFGGRWQYFENQICVSDLSASLAVEYAIRCRRERWYRFENKIKRSVEPLARYRAAFPGSIPKTEAEVFKEQIQSWRNTTTAAHPRPLKSGTQGLAEDRKRYITRERWLVHGSSARLEKFARLFASLVTSDAKHWYEKKLNAYFDDFESEVGQSVNLKIARLLCRRFGQRIESLEHKIATDAICSFNYALSNSDRFLEGEDVIRKDTDLWIKYENKFFRKAPETTKRKYYTSRLMLPSNIRYEWS